MNAFNNLLSPQFVHALGWTIIHSLWQGSLAALAFVLILFSARRASSRARYTAGVMTLGFFLIMALITFWSSLASFNRRPATKTAIIHFLSFAESDTLPLQVTSQPSTQDPSLLAKINVFFSEYFNRHLPLIVTFWLLGVLFFALRFAGGFLYVQRLKYHHTQPMPGQWTERLDSLCRAADIRQPIRWLQSLRTNTPLVIGHFKPAILFPLHLLSGLSPEQIEVLIAHELAHIVRSDYLVNILQNLTEILFFFHPGVRWISTCVRSEREHCCDDFAVTLCGDSLGYAKALAHLQSSATWKTQLSPAATGHSRKLLQRIRRLLNHPRAVHDFRQGFLSALFLLVCLFAALKILGAAPAFDADRSQPVAGITQPGVSQKSEFAVKTLELKSNGTVILSGKVPAGQSDHCPIWIVKADQVVWFMNIGTAKEKGRAVPFQERIYLVSGQYKLYVPITCAVSLQIAGASLLSQQQEPMYNEEEEAVVDNKAKLQLTEELQRLDEEKSKLQAEKERQLHELKEAQLREEQRKVEYEKKLRQQLEEEKALYEEQHSQEEQRKIAEETERAQREEMIQTEEELRKQLNEMKEQERVMRVKEKELQGAEERLKIEEEHMKAEEERMKIEEQRLKYEEERIRVEEKNLDSFIEELAHEKLISKEKGYRIKLSQDSLEINGKKQPAAIFEKFKQLYQSLFGKKIAGKQVVTIVNEKE